ncbi:helicase associated domain-containing protein [Hydrogenophaga atypica]|uniref:Helicase associated domain-containing protein n=1 Tax=Hydrogenophaga atypica TaxID=249409 RepID=A0ABW2QPU5_9BURK
MTPHLSENATQAADRLIASVEGLFATGTKTTLPEDDLGFLCARVKSARTGYPFVLEEHPAQSVNRLGSVLLGPVFTSKAHAWPVDADGSPMAPLCQLNTAYAPKTFEGLDGLVQVWLTPSGGAIGPAFIRVVPAAEADAALMTPVIEHSESIDVLLPEAAEWLREFHSGLKPSKNQYITAAAVKLGHASADELSDADWEEWLRLAAEYHDRYGDDVVPCFQITGFEEGRVYCDITEDQKSAMGSLEKLRKKLEKKGSAGDEALVQHLANTCSAYEDWVNLLGNQAYPCLLGTFQEIQYRAADMSAPFVCFEAIGLREWGDGGNAQVFYSKESGFSFDWSCF